MPLLPRSRWIPLTVALLLAGGIVACSDPFRIKASLDVVEDTLVFNSVSDASAPSTAPVVLDIADQPSFDPSSRKPVARRLGADFSSRGLGFDVALDVQGDSLVFLPPRKLTTSLGSVRRVGLRVDPSITFDAALSAPSKGYVFDTVSVGAREGNTVFIVSRHPVCANEFNTEIYAKVGVLDIDPVAKTATLRVRLDPNCGFRSFLPGVPSR